METKFNFKSQICTTREQSERSLSLGLKKETADMVLLKEMVYDEENHCTRDGEDYLIRPIDYLEGEEHRGHTPAWSLHRLIEMVAHTQYPYYVISKELPIYDALCERIEWLIKEGYFKKNYLEHVGEETD